MMEKADAISKLMEEMKNVLATYRNSTQYASSYTTQIQSKKEDLKFAEQNLKVQLESSKKWQAEWFRLSAKLHDLIRLQQEETKPIETPTELISDDIGRSE